LDKTRKKQHYNKIAQYPTDTRKQPLMKVEQLKKFHFHKSIFRCKGVNILFSRKFIKHMPSY